MASVRKLDELKQSIRAVGKSGALPLSGPMDKIVDELQRRVGLLNEVVLRLLDHVRAGVDWNENEDSRHPRYFEINYSEVGTVTWDGSTVLNGVIFHHGSGVDLNRYIVVRQTYARAITFDPTNSEVPVTYTVYQRSFAPGWRVVRTSTSAVLIQVDQSFVDNQAVVGLLFYDNDTPFTGRT